MQCIASLKDLNEPTHIVACSGVREHAFAVSLHNKQYWKKSWLHEQAEEDAEKIERVNSRLPKCSELSKCFTGKYNKKLAEYYVGPKIIGFDDEILLDMPDAIFLQRISSRTKTFDMILFYGTKAVTFEVVDKADLDTIRDWFPHKIYSCGADPLPLNSMTKWLEENKGKDMYDKIYENLFNREETSCSEYEPDTCPESEDESCTESEEEWEEETCESEEEYDSEPPAKKIKL